MALNCLARMFDGQVADDGSIIDVRELFIESADAAWSNETATGDATFLPGHFRAHFEAACQPEGNVFFVGEHLSRHHTWIAGALESSLQAVRDILKQPTLPPLCGLSPFIMSNKRRGSLEMTPPPKYAQMEDVASALAPIQTSFETFNLGSRKKSMPWAESPLTATPLTFTNSGAIDLHSSPVTWNSISYQPTA